MSIFDDDLLGDMFDFDGDGKTSIDEEFLAYQMFEDSFKDDENNDDYDDLDDDLDVIDYYNYTYANPHKTQNNFSAAKQDAKNTNNTFSNSQFIANEEAKKRNQKRDRRIVCIVVIAFAVLCIIGRLSNQPKKPYVSEHGYSISSTTTRYKTTKATTTTTTKKKTTTTTYKKSKKTTATTKDPYNAKSYDHPEDFYEDYYDDFWDFYDAEDYYYDHQ